jgi:hypothetical protein
VIPNETYKQFTDGRIDLTSDILRVALGNGQTAYDPDPAADNTVSDVFDNGTTATEYNDSGYSRQDLSSVTTGVDDSNNRAVVTADNVTFSSLGTATGGQTVQFIVIYKQVGGDDSTPADDRILRVIDDSESSELPKQSNGEDFTIDFDATDGVLTLGT